MLKISPSYIWHHTSRLAHFFMVVGGLAFIVLGAGVLSLRYWVLPDVMRYHDRFQRALTEAVGLPVALGAIRADWDGFRPHLVVDSVQVLDAEKLPALELRKVEGTLSWRSLLTGKLSLHSLEINNSILVLRRDEQGVIYVAGVPLSRTSQNNGLADLLLYQRLIVIRDAQVYWYDAKRDAETLHLNKVYALIENRGDRHRFAVRAVPQAALATPIDLRGDLRGESFDRMQDWHGEFFVQLDHTDLQAWRPWVDLPSSVSRGRGGVRAWIGMEQGRFTQTAADLALVDVVSHLGDDVPELALSRLNGRLAWRASRGEFEVSSKQLGLRLMQGTVLPPTDFFLKLAESREKYPPRGEIRASQLHLPTLLNLSQFFPLAPAMREQLRSLAPEGQVRDLSASWGMAGEALQEYRISGRFEGLGLHKLGVIPGFSGLSGEVDGTEKSGRLTVSSRQFSLDAPLLMREPLSFPELKAQMRWQRNHNGMEYQLAESSFRNADVAGALAFTFQTVPDGLGIIDLEANLTHAEVGHAARYIPLVALNQATHDWLATALKGGQTAGLRLKLKGDLADFPFAGKRKGEFRLETHAQNVALEYVPGWPRVENASVDLRIEGAKLEVSCPTATTVGGGLKDVKVVLADMVSPAAMLEIGGEFTGPVARGLEFIQQSPVRGYIDEFTDGMSASGDGHLDLKVQVPLRGNQPVSVAGQYEFLDDELMLAQGLPKAMHTRGKLMFTESGVHTQSVTTQILGGPATVQVDSGEGGTLQVKAVGRIHPETVRASEPYAVLRYLRGESDWAAHVSVRKKAVDAVVSSSLAGLASDLPTPFGKRAEEVVPFRLEQKSVQPGQDGLVVRYGEVVEARLQRQESGDEMQVVRGTVNFGGAAKSPDKDGVWLTGSIPELALDGWGGLSSGGDGSVPALAGIDLTVQKLTGGRHKVDGVHLTGRSRGNALELRLASDDVSGSLNWMPEGKGALVARLKSLKLESQPAGDAREVSSGLAVPPVGERIPKLDVTVDSLSWNSRQLGHFELAGQPRGRDWRLEKLSLNNPEGVLGVDGVLQTNASGGDVTQMNVALQIYDAGRILDRSGYPNSVKQGSGKLEGQFAWFGGPAQFNYATLDGHVKLEAGRGQFMKIDPGIGKLLSILSLQALPKRITLDFKDVFSEGFQFDSINGEAQIRRGVLRSDTFSIEGSAAKVNMRGEVDLNRETQNLRVRILPTVGNSVSLIGALVINPVVGVGTYLANKLLSNPLDRLVSFEYNITGNWANPSVVKVGEVPVEPPKNPLLEN
jgi:uncharacterized protein (TIGR02099 family)